MADDNGNFDHLDGAGQATAAIARRPRFAVNLVLGLAIGLSWFVLIAMSARTAALVPGGSGPGSDLLRFLPWLPLPAFFERFLQLCLAPTAVGTAAVANFAALASMWFLMALAMMVPSAAPMIRTYCEIADTGRAKGEPVVHPLVLVAGYLAVWLCASLAFAGISLAVQAGPAASASTPVQGIAGAAVLLLAGFYQFSGLKESCLKKCGSPFPILFSRWSSDPARIFRLGVDQGIWCLGCCWALMLVMFAVGLMNVFWMALIALLTVVEKQVGGQLPTRVAGAILLVWAVALLLISA
jgi:predicted metal-binding membrane protein